MTEKLFVLNGPNLNLLGRREPALYGSTTLEEVRADCDRVAAELGRELVFAQTNAEHRMIDWVQEAFLDGGPVVINPAGFSFQSVPVLDALRMVTAPLVEVHITNIHSRDPAHRHSLVSTVARAVIAGAGVYGYELAMRAADRFARAA
ncbi:type II 3-dehydroquinate dehydratase [Microbacterium sp. NPDC091313]